MRMDYVYDQLHRIISRVRFDKRLVLGMGNRQNLEKMNSYFHCYSVGLEAVLDNDPAKRGMFYDDLMIYKTEEILVPFNDKVLIFIYSPGYWREMRDQLLDLGYQENKHFYVIHEKKQEIGQMRIFMNNFQMAKRGYKIYESIRKKYGQNTEIILMRGATGDVFLNGLYLDGYLKAKGVDKYVVVGDSKGLSKITELFRIESVEPLNYWDAEALQNCYKFCKLEHFKPVFLWQLSLHLNRCQTRMHRNFNFLDTYTYYIYEGMISKEQWKKPEFVELSDDLRKKYEDMGIKEGRSVVLAPYAYSVHTLPSWFWKRVIEGLKNKGYEVFINLNPNEELNKFAGTHSVFFSFQELEAALSYAGHFLALRSGLCDIVAMIDCHQVILYPEEMSPIDYTVHRSDIDFSSFRSMGFETDHIDELSSPAIHDIVVKYESLDIDEMVHELERLCQRIMDRF